MSNISTATDAVAILREALQQVGNYCSDFYANAKVRGAEAAHKRAHEMAMRASDALAATEHAQVEAQAAQDDDIAKQNAVQQAQQCAQEARTQRATVLSILRYFGLPENDWEALRLIMAKVDVPAEPVQAVADLMPKRALFIDWCRSRFIDTDEDKDAWGKRKFRHEHVESMWSGWFNAPTEAASVRDAALEEAVQACEAARDQCNERDSGKWPELRADAADGAGECVAAIRALQGKPSAAPVSSQPATDYRAVLINVQKAFVAACDDADGPITDTIWMTHDVSVHETLFDYMDSALEGGGDPGEQLELPEVAAPVAVPEGWKLVPIEPTSEMVNAPNTIIQAYGAGLIYKRMLDAAPSAPLQAQPKEAGSKP